MDRFEIIQHTADKAIRAFGRDIPELFENAAFGMFSLMADLSKYPGAETRTIAVNSTDREELLRTWLDELLFQFEVDRILFVDFEIQEIDDTSVKGNARGLPFSPDIEWLGSAVKAVTHHDLYVRQKDDHWEAQVVFDV